MPKLLQCTYPWKQHINSLEICYTVSIHQHFVPLAIITTAPQRWCMSAHKLNTAATECMLTKSIKHKKQDGKANPNWLMHEECHLPTLSRIAEVWRSSSCFSAVAINGFRVLTSKYNRHLSFSSCSLACTIVQHNDAKNRVTALWSLLLSPILHAEGGRLFQWPFFD
jgi:hypothetical protein